MVRNVDWQQLGAVVSDGERLTDEQIKQFSRCAGRWIAPVVNGDPASSTANWNSCNLPELRDRCKAYGVKLGMFIAPGTDTSVLPYDGGPLILSHAPGLDVGAWREALPDWAIAVACASPEQIDWPIGELGVHALLGWNSLDYLKKSTGDPVNQLKRAKADGLPVPMLHALLGVRDNDLRVELLDVLEAKLKGYGIGVVVNGLEDVSEVDDADPYGRGGQWKLLAAQAGRLWLP